MISDWNRKGAECAWCSEASSAKATARTSHGICPSCLEERLVPDGDPLRPRAAAAEGRAQRIEETTTDRSGTVGVSAPSFALGGARFGHKNANGAVDPGESDPNDPASLPPPPVPTLGPAGVAWLLVLLGAVGAWRSSAGRRCGPPADRL